MLDYAGMTSKSGCDEFYRNLLQLSGSDFNFQPQLFHHDIPHLEFLGLAGDRHW